jgi:hypothetical protein
MKNFVKLAISLGEFDMIVSIIRSMKDVCSWSSGELYVLLDHGQITAVSALLIGNPVWKSALDAACYNGDFGTLEAMLFQGSELPFFDHFGDNNDFLIQEQQVYFRVIAFHAIATGNFKLCEWLLQIGMDADELHLCEMQNNDMAVVKAPVTYCSLAGGGGDLVRYSWCTIPSLLAVAAQHNHEDWMRHLLAQGIRSADSGALVWAVKTKASNFPAQTTGATYTDFLHKSSGNCCHNSLSLERSRAWKIFRPTKLWHCCTPASHPVPRLHHHRCFV